MHSADRVKLARYFRKIALIALEAEEVVDGDKKSTYGDKVTHAAEATSQIEEQVSKIWMLELWTDVPSPSVRNPKQAPKPAPILTPTKRVPFYIVLGIVRSRFGDRRADQLRRDYDGAMQEMNDEEAAFVFAKEHMTADELVVAQCASSPDDHIGTLDSEGYCSHCHYR